MKSSSFLLLMLLSLPFAIPAQVGLSWSEELSELLQEDFKSQSFAEWRQSQVGSMPLIKEAGFTNRETADPLGVFCQLDFNLDQKLPFKLRFRLGEYHYTHQLEYGAQPDLSNQIE